MDPERWRRIEDLALAALDRSPETREAWLADACGDDAELRREVEAQVRAFEDDPDFLETPIVRVADAAGDDAELPSTARRIGPFRLTRPLGRGGMGEVYLAVQEGDDFEQTVAVKIIRAGSDSEEVVRRFRLERRILASLHHPNIAQLLDGGATADGRPYFVMEYVDGAPVTEYCENHRLGLRERIQLFRVICSAVQHAHQNLVVHRDLKPGNILVTADGVPKLLDFGIGKMLAPGTNLDAVNTRTEVRVLTPEYAAPEQIRGEPVTTAADVYGLGVLLYRLLAGRHPVLTGGETVQEVERAICETDPARPSAVEGPFGRRLAGDLDAIVMKALRKEPERRFPTAAALADDLDRYLDGRPVLARRGSTTYRAGKFVRRHAAALAIGAVVVGALGATAWVSQRQSRRVAEERDRALEVRGFLLEMFGAAGANQAADSVTAGQLLDQRAATIDEAYADRPILQAEMLEVLAEGYDRLGRYDTAQALARRSLEVRERELGEDHPDVARSLNVLGWVLHEQGHSDSARPLLERAVAIRRSAGRRYRLVLSRALNDLGVVNEVQSDLDGADTLYREALAIRTDILGEDNTAVGITANNLATLAYRRLDYAEAVRFGEQSLAVLRRAVGPDHQRSMIAQGNLALFKRRAGRHEAAEAEYRDLLARQMRVQGEDHPITAFVMSGLSDLLYELGQLEEAEDLARRTLAVREATLGGHHYRVASTLTGLSKIRAARGDLDEALELERRGLAIRKLNGETHPRVGTSLSALAGLNERVGDAAAAERRYREVLALYNEVLEEGDSRTVGLRLRYGRFLLKEGRPRDALEELSAAHAAAVAAERAAQVRSTLQALADAHRAVGDSARADSLLAAAADS